MRAAGWDHACAGAVSGAASKVVTSPLSVIGLNAAVGGGNQPIFLVAKRVLKEGGVLSFWRGCTVSVVGAAPVQAGNFFCFDFFKRQIRDGRAGTKSMSSTDRLLAGGLAGVSTQLLLHPLDVIGTRARLLRASTLKITRTIVKQGGVRGLYAGLVPAVLAILPTSAVSFGCYDSMKHALLNAMNEETHPECRAEAIPMPATFACGVVSGCLGVTAGYPLNLAAQRLQVQGVLDIAWKKPYGSTADALARIVRFEGAQGLFSGWSASMIKILPATGVGFTVFEMAKREMAHMTDCAA